VRNESDSGWTPAMAAQSAGPKRVLGGKEPRILACSESTFC
jgi:hypothetical protein